MLLLVVMNWLALSGSRRHGQERRPGSGMDRADVIYHPIQYTPSIRDLPHITVFVHAAVGIFNKIRGKGTWGYGQQILEELLKSINDSGLLQKSNAVYIGLLGKEEDRLSAKSHIKQYSSKAQVVMEAENLVRLPIIIFYKCDTSSITYLVMLRSTLQSFLHFGFYRIIRRQHMSIHCCCMHTQKECGTMEEEGLKVHSTGSPTAPCLHIHGANT